MEDVEAAEALALATRGGRDACWVLAVRQVAALLVARPKMRLLIVGAGARGPRALAITGHIVAIAQDRVPHTAHLVGQHARVRLAARPRAGADLGLAAGQQFARLVAEATVELLVDLAAPLGNGGAVGNARSDGRLRLLGVILFLGEALHRQMRVAGRRGVVVALATTHSERLAGLVVEDVQAAQALGLAASGCSDTVRELAIGQQAALLVADANVHLLVGEARAGLVRAAIAAADVVALAEQGLANRRLLVLQAAGVLLAARPGAAADRLLASSQEAAFLVAEAVVELLVEVADVAVVEVLNGRELGVGFGRARLRLRRRLLGQRSLCRRRVRSRLRDLVKQVRHLHLGLLGDQPRLQEPGSRLLGILLRLSRVKLHRGA
mmetsp:Transcript_68818/g.177276  ORF Transcript_68818/g.177276 Transcript_68818/m.177276 type:complete len:381 (-) Transcript_68818:251-1393(-)